MARLLVDLDDTISDHLGKLLPDLEYVTGDHYRRAMLKTWDIGANLHVSTAVLERIWSAPCWYAGVRPLPYAQEVLARLHRAGHEILIVTATAASMFQDRLVWLQQHLPWLDTTQIKICQQKFLLDGDFLIDDGPHNIASWGSAHPKGRTITMDAPYNRHLKTGYRIFGWTSMQLLARVLGLL